VHDGDFQAAGDREGKCPMHSARVTHRTVVGRLLSLEHWSIWPICCSVPHQSVSDGSAGPQSLRRMAALSEVAE